MFNELRHIRKLRKRVAALTEREEKLREDVNYNVTERDRVMLSARIFSARTALDYFETNRLIRTARQLGIEIPNKESWWREHPDGNDYTLTDIGKAGVSKLIREERRKTIEWWVKTITPILGALISLLGLIVALISVSKK